MQSSRSSALAQRTRTSTSSSGTSRRTSSRVPLPPPRLKRGRRRPVARSPTASPIADAGRAATTSRRARFHTTRSPARRRKAGTVRLRPARNYIPRFRRHRLMLRNSLLYLSSQPRVFRFVRNNKLAKGLANCFFARETIDSAIAAIRELNAKGITASLDFLCESVHTQDDTAAARDDYLGLLD